MAQLTVQKVSLTGVSPTFAAADVAGDKFANSGREFLIVKNGGAAAITVTVNSEKPCSYGFDHDLEVSVGASGEQWIGPFVPNRFNDIQGNVNVTYSGITSVTVAAVSL